MLDAAAFVVFKNCENVDCGDAAAVTKVLAQISICLFLAHCRATGEYINIHGGFSVKSPQKHDSHQIMIYLFLETNFQVLKN